jgi:hypothetical protein
MAHSFLQRPFTRGRASQPPIQQRGEIYDLNWNEAIRAIATRTAAP